MTAIKLPQYIGEKCLDFARGIIERYTGDEHPHSMPWSRNLMTDDELREWRASRKVAGQDIDIETCEIGWWRANANGDPYGIGEILGEEDHLEKGYSDNFHFVRSPQSNGWICEGDLPEASIHALYDRIRREAKE